MSDDRDCCAGEEIYGDPRGLHTFDCPEYQRNVAAILDLVGRYAEACVEAEASGSPKGRQEAREQRKKAWATIKDAVAGQQRRRPSDRDAAARLDNARVASSNPGVDAAAGERTEP